MTSPDIFGYIKSEESKFETEQVQIGDNWQWNFRDHVQLIFHLKNGVFFTGSNNWLRAFKNIMEPILNLSYWTEDIEVKDVVFYIEEDDSKVLSFLIKKYHDEVYVKKYDLDTLFDEITESDVDYGGTLIQKGVDMPEVLQLNSLAFCDQTDLMGSALGFKFFFSPDKLRSMSKYGWGNESNGATMSLDELATLATDQKEVIGTRGKKKNTVPGKSIELYIVRGPLPEAYLKDNDNMEAWYGQLQIVAFYTNKDNNKQGVILYRKSEDEGMLKFFTSKKVYQRALGRGVGEAMLHPQIWSNFLEIHKMNMLEAASKIPLQTDDPNFTTKNNVQDMENLQVAVMSDGKRIEQIPTAAPANIALFSNEINAWYDHAQLAGSAFDPLMGKEAPSGSTFRGQERVVAQGKGLHDRRRGQRAKFIEEIYRDWIIPDIKKEILNGQKFLATLSMDELEWVSEKIATVEASKIIKDAVIYKGQAVTPEQRDALIKVRQAEIQKQGNRHLVEILKGDFEDVEIKVNIDIAGKQKDLANLSDKLLSIFQFIFQNPQGFQQAMQIPAMAKAFENLLEYGGMNVADFSSLMNVPAPSPMQMQQGNIPQAPQPQQMQLNTQPQ